MSGMTVWTPQLEETIRQALDEVTPAESGREHLGRPFITAYQLAIKVHRLDDQIARTLRVEIGGEGIGQYNSLAQYLARQLSRQIKDRGTAYPVEGAQLSSAHTRSMTFRHPAGGEIANSNISAGYDTLMFRLRDQPTSA